MTTIPIPIVKIVMTNYVGMYLYHSFIHVSFILSYCYGKRNDLISLKTKNNKLKLQKKRS